MSSPPINLVFLDAAADPSGILHSSSLENAELILLDPAQNVIQQMTEVLAQRQNVASLHWVTHGNVGEVLVGGDAIALDTLQSHQSQLQSWRTALTEDADILLYGCNVAAGEVGNTFIQTLSQLTGADVAASTDLTGSAALGGDWTLEVSTGAIASTLAFDATTLAAFNTVLESFNFANFSSVAGITFNGNAAQAGTVLRLTPPDDSQVGSAFVTAPVAIDANTSFQTRFQFRLHDGNGSNGADGMTFMLQNDPRGAGSLGELGGSLGYGDREFTRTPPIRQSLAIEFDTFRNGWDPNNNHVAVLRNGDVTTPIVSANPTLDLNSGVLLTAWVDYDGASDRLTVYLSDGTTRPTTALLSTTVDLATTVGSRAFLGFSGGTGGLFNAQDIHSWEWSSSTTAPDTAPPTATLNAPNFTAAGTTTRDFTVTYTDQTAVDVASLGTGDVVVTGPNNYEQIATLQSVTGTGGNVTATYRITAPGGVWDEGDVGSYTVALRANEVRDTLGQITPAATLGNFQFAVPIISLAQSRYTVNENGGTVEVAFSRTGGSDGISTVEYTTVNGTAIAGSDYVATSGVLTFNPGETSKTVILTVLDDNLVEGEETFSISANRVTGAALLAPRTAVIAINDDDVAPGFSFNLANFSSVSQLQLNANAAQSGNVLRLTPDTTGQRGSAYWQQAIAITSNTSFQTQFQFRLSGVRGTNGADGFTFLLQNSAGGSTAIGGSGGSVGYAGIGRSLAVEFDTFRNSTDPNNNHLSLLRDGNVTQALLNANTAIDLNSGTAVNAWVDYNGTTDQLAVFLSSDTTKPTTALFTQTIDLATVLGDRAFIGFTAGTGGLFNNQDIQNWSFSSNTGVFVETPRFNFSQPTLQVNENGTSLTVTVNRTGSTTGAATVEYFTQNGTATAPEDYTAATGTLTFAAGETSRTFTVAIADDTTPERNETFTLRLRNAVGGELGTQSSLVATIVDNDTGNFTRERVVGGLNQPTAFDWTADQRYLFIAQKDGIVRVFDKQTNTLQATPLIDIRDQVNNVRDRGLLGIAVHPDFANNPYIYLLFTYDPPETANFANNPDPNNLAGPDEIGNRPSRLIRVTAQRDANGNWIAPRSSELVLLGRNSIWNYTSRPDADSTDNINLAPSGINNGTTINAPANLIEDAENNIRDYIATDSQSHTIGALRFGLDGSLFVSNGDGASYGRVDPRATRVQDLDNLSGKLLRINPLTGQGYADNPFFNNNLDSNRSKVYSYGLRNPFRFTINPANGEPVIGDVGWNSWEEVNTGRGANFGWPYFEGGNGTSERQPGYASLPAAQAFYNSGQPVVAPLFGESHVSGANAIAVGDFYTGTTYPEVYRNSLFVTDLVRGTVDALLFDANGRVESTKRFSTGQQYLTQITMGNDSNLYYVSLTTGEIGRWRPA